MKVKYQAMSFDELCTLVGSYDQEAEAYLRGEHTSLKSFCTDGEDALDTIMVWSETPQGHKYWKNIFLNIYY